MQAFLTWGMLLLSQSLLFLPGLGHFLQGDAIFWIAHRRTSWQEFLFGFLELDAHQWYRPLSHGLSGSILFPLFQLAPAPYHLFSLSLLILTSVGAWKVFLHLSSSKTSAIAALFYFGIHSTHGFTSFGAAFDPDLLAGLFWTVAVWAFLRHMEGNRLAWLAGATASFALGLVSKETLLALPLTLLLVWYLLPGRKRVAPGPALASLGLVAGTYLVWVGLFLRKGDLFTGSLRSHYSVSAGWNLPQNLFDLSAWAFNLPAGWHTHWRDPGPVLGTFLWVLAVSILALWLFRLVRGGEPARRLCVGFGWFLTALLPTLFLNEVKPYYLFAALPGFALAVGEAAEELRRRFGRRRQVAEWGVAVLGLLLLVSNWLAVAADRENHPLLGRSAKINEQSLATVRQSLPRPNPETMIIILNPEGDSLLWHYADGDLFRLGLGEPDLEVRFPYYGDSVAADRKKLHAFLFQDFSLREISDRFRRDPAEFLEREEQFRYLDAPPDLIGVTPSRLVQEKGAYTIRIPRFAGEQVEIQYRINGGPIGIFPARLDNRGEVSFFVSRETRPGEYRFFAVRPGGAEAWLRGGEAHLTVERP